MFKRPFPDSRAAVRGMLRSSRLLERFARKVWMKPFCRLSFVALARIPLCFAVTWIAVTVDPLAAQQVDPFGPPGVVAGEVSNPLVAPPPVAGSALGGAPGPAPPVELFEPAETAARVGDQFIFMGELLGDANLVLALGPKIEPEQLTQQQRMMLDAQRDQLVSQLLDAAIDRKLMYIEFLRGIPAEKLDEALSTISDKIGQTFSENLFKMLDRLNTTPVEEYPPLIRQEARLFRLAYMMQQRNLTSLGQLEAVLRENGSSLKKQQDAYAERLLGQQEMRDAIDNHPEITHLEILKYYEEHPEEFHVPARARWRQITIRFNRCESKQQAGEMIAALGNQLFLGGAPFWAVAKRSSHGPKAADGGLHDWTDKGDLEVSQQIDEAVFHIPVNQLSGIIQDAEGLHIVLVLERTEEHMIPFTEAQVDIKAALQSKKRGEAIAKYVARLKEQTPVWPTQGDKVTR